MAVEKKKKDTEDTEAYRALVKERLDALLPIFQKASVGDFSEHAPPLPQNDEFAVLYAGIDILLEVARRRFSDLEKSRLALVSVLEDIQLEKAKDEAMLIGIGEGLVATDRDGVIIVVNKSFEEMTQWSAQEVMGKRMVDVLPREDETGALVPFAERILPLVLSGQKISTQTHNHSYFRRKDGTRFPVKITVTPIRLDQKIIGALELFSDVTMEKQLEQTRRDFLSLASHQLRTPLSSTRWVMETLLRGVAGELNEKQKKYVQQVYEVTIQMIKLATDTLHILRLESGVVTVNPEPFTSKDIFNEVVKTLSVAAQKKGIALEVKRGEVSLLSDFHLTRNIVESLVSNAIDYSATGKKVVLGAKDSPDEVWFSVKDSGIGIPKEEQKKIFQRFYRASNSNAQKTDGSGLGLSMSEMLAERLGGNITFESEEGKGSTFFLRLPKKR